MSNVIESVVTSFKSLVAEKPYRSITVKEICERAFISRHTFYMNFVDKRAIAAYLFRRDAMHPVERAMKLLSKDEAIQLAPIMFERFYSGVLDQRDYYSALVKPMAGVDPTFELVVARCVYKEIDEIVRRFNPHPDESRLDYVAYYHASAQAIFLEKWIHGGFAMSPEDLGRMQAEVVVPSLVWASGEKSGGML